jgi:CRP-like cAMP-binding protein
MAALRVEGSAVQTMSRALRTSNVHEMMSPPAGSSGDRSVAEHCSGAVAAAPPALKAFTTQLAMLAALPLLQGMQEDALAGLLKASRTMRVGKGSYLVRRGDACEGLYLMAKGRAQLLMPKSDESEHGCDVLCVVEAGMSFGETAMLLGTCFPVSCRSLRDCEVVVVPRTALMPVLQALPDLQVRILNVLSLQLRRMTQDIAHRTQMSAEGRIAAHLLDLAGNGSNRVFHLTDNKRSIAMRLSVAPETLSRAFRAMKEEGLISVNGYMIEILNPPALRRLAEQ